MPQLMPLLWLCSVFMVMIILIMLIMMYCNKDSWSISSDVLKFDLFQVNFEW